MLASILTVHTEFKLPGKIQSTNGEQMMDGTVLFTHPLVSSSSIDIVDEVPDVPHILIAVLLALVALVGGITAFIRERCQRSTGTVVGA
jgi:hypothetical protein